METFSDAFCRAVRVALEHGCALLGTIVQRRDAFAGQVKTRPGVRLIEVGAHNRVRPSRRSLYSNLTEV